MAHGAPTKLLGSVIPQTDAALADADQSDVVQPIVDRRRPRANPKRRGLDAGEVAAILGRSKSWFYEHRPRLEAAGFPPKNPLTGTWDAHAIHAWWNRQSGLDGDVEDETDGWHVG